MDRFVPQNYYTLGQDSFFTFSFLYFLSHGILPKAFHSFHSLFIERQTVFFIIPPLFGYLHYVQREDAQTQDFAAHYLQN